MEKFPNRLAKKLKARAASNALRTLRGTEDLVDFSSNDYLGFARNKGITSWALQLVSDTDMVRNGATGSRLLSGNHVLYVRLEELLEQVHEGPALVFNSGYDANLGFFSSVPQRSDVVLYDERVHASIRDGISLGLAQNYKFGHNNLLDLEHRLKRVVRGKSNNVADDDLRGECYVVTESVFSMEGDSPDLKALVDLCRENGCRLVVDEAHAAGVYGPGGVGLLQELGLHRETFARILTFGKAMGAHGAAIVGDMLLREYLLNFARSFIYTTAMPPHAIATLLAAYHYSATKSGQDRQHQLQGNIGTFLKQVASLELTPYFTPSKSAIHCCLLPGNTRVRQASEKLRTAGYDVRPILAPTVPEGQERLRFCLHSYNTKSQIGEVLDVLAGILRKS